eukprot:RCo033631
MNQQTILESRRILAVVDDLLEDLTIQAHIPSYLSQFQASDLQYFGPDLQRQLSVLFDIERKIELSQGAPSEELTLAHRAAVRATTDALRGVGFGVSEKYSPQTSAEDSMLRFSNIIQTLRDLLNEKFNTTVEEDLQKFEILRDTVSREQTASADVKALNREVQSEKNLRRVEVQRRDVAIKKLTEELESIQSSAVEEAREFEREVKEQEEAAAVRYKTEEEALLARVQALEANLAKAEELNHKDEAALRQERRKREQFLDGLLTQYDSEMSKKTTDLADLGNEYDRAKRQLEDLDKDLKVFDEDQAKRDEEDKIERERKMHLDAILRRMEKSVKLVQAFWRGFAVRTAMKKKAGKKKKGGGKGKK